MTKLNKNQRAEYVLNLVIKSYLELGVPISSKFVVDTSDIQASPATIRNVMVGLEQDGFIYSPHTSAGRIPTTRGLRYFVNQLLSFESADQGKLQQLTANLVNSATPQEMCNKAARMIADMTRLTGLVAMPKSNDAVIRQLELVRLADQRLLCVLIDQHDEVQNRVVDLPFSVADSVLQQTLQMLNSALAGFSLEEGRQRLGYFLKQANPEVNELVRRALFGDSVELTEQVLFRTSETRLLNSEIATETEDLKQVLKAVENFNLLQPIFSACCSSDSVHVFIGDEMGVPALAKCTMVAKSFKKDNKVAGVMAVVGPTRIDYESVISAVDLSANILTSALNRRQ
ncbi:heat-inducible transcription repressor HrcA [Psychrosphaera ytuae]|uniref:Heat-inducible transcription repressor HrcA n=1 Tax=Psychrosphaera ytuae TaxID=2820710 RepID=A0A975DD01_9GAMM|nr:heat-inducible transcriptional repressor HrcA [Psychrosphaera ytuae]QTH64892.1 heat-inducible transcription repressor HrcA [Psychrosphaera ytuae]